MSTAEHKIRNLMQVAGVMVSDLNKTIHYEETFEDGSTASEFTTEPNFEVIEKICISYSAKLLSQRDELLDIAKKYLPKLLVEYLDLVGKYAGTPIMNDDVVVELGDRVKKITALIIEIEAV